MRLPVVSLTALLFTAASAVFIDEAWHTDYHFALLGAPKEDTTFFHQPDPTSKASLLYTLSEEGVVGAVNPRDGSLVWRQWLSHSSSPANASFLRASDGQDVVVSGFHNRVAAWNALDGRLVWEHATSGPLADLEILELVDSEAVPGSKDTILLAGGEKTVVERIDGITGTPKWTYSVEGGDSPYQISASATELFVIFLHKTLLGYIKIKVVSLDPVSGTKKDEYTLSSDTELSSPDTIISVGANSASPIVVWTDASYSVIKVNVLGSKAVSTFNVEKSADSTVSRIRLHAPHHTNSLAHFLVHYETKDSHWAEVFHVDLHKNHVEKAYQLPKLSGRGTFSTSSIDANVYFTRITSEEVTTVSSTSHGILGRWPVYGFGITSRDTDDNVPLRSVSEVSVRDDSVSAIRSAILLASGEWVLLRDGKPIWQRLEVLAGTRAATFALPEEAQALAEALEIETHSGLIGAYVHRVQRHLLDLQQLPQVLASLPKRITAGFLGTTADNGEIGDTFGFHQIVACAARRGRVLAIDAGKPDALLWSRQVIDLSSESQWNPVFKPSSAGILALEPSEGSPIIYLNASNGSPLSSLPPNANAPSAPGSISYTLHDNSIEARRANQPESESLWRFVAPAGSRVVAVTPRPIDDPVASIGKVLGDRRVLYKYLSPNIALLTTVHDSSRSAAFYMIDTASGTALHSNVHHNVDIKQPLSALVSENWFAYSYTSDASAGHPKGHHLVVGEMFESLVPNDRGPLNANDNSSNLEPHVLTKTYQISEPISKLAVTRTRQGITSRQLLAVLADSSSLVGIPYTVLDPRRPVGRDPTKDEQAEGLIRYAPVIDFDPKWILNHKREVLDIAEVITSPASIESTTLIFAYGLDVFGTRLSPSFSFDILGKNFNKFQMLATVAALAVATFVVGPLVSQATYRIMLFVLMLHRSHESRSTRGGSSLDRVPNTGARDIALFGVNGYRSDRMQNWLRSHLMHKHLITPSILSEGIGVMTGHRSPNLH